MHKPRLWSCGVARRVLTSGSSLRPIFQTVRARLFFLPQDSFGSDLTVVHAFHVPYEAWLKSDDVKDYVRTEAQKGLEAFLAQEELAPLASRIEPIVDEGETGSVVMRQLERTRRSEEHTSELQSLMRISYAVFCLKKKQKQQNNNN